MTNQKVYTLYSDPGHGWLAVKAVELKELGILEKITSYSYMRGETVYLEEDCDLSTFFEAYRAKFGVNPSYKHKITKGSNPSSIRSYQSFNPDFAILPELKTGQKWNLGSMGVFEIYNIQGSKIYLKKGSGNYSISKNNFFSYCPSLVEEKES